MWPMLAALALPLVEIALFILVGGWIGIWPTLGLVALAVVAGVMILRSQGAGALGGLRRAARMGQDPGPVLARGVLRVFAGLLLIVPGFLTDALALALLVPGVERLVMRRMRGRMPGQTQGQTQSQTRAGMQAAGAQDGAVRPDITVIDAEFEEITPGQRPTHGPSGWTRH